MTWLRSRCSTPTSSRRRPAGGRRFKRAIAAADALLIATPEYNHCVPGVLKNAIDWASRPARRSVLTGKPVAIMGASTGRGATARAQAHLRDGLAYTNGFVLPLPEVLVGLARERFDDDGNLTDPGHQEEIRDLLVSLAAWTRRLDVGGRGGRELTTRPDPDGVDRRGALAHPSSFLSVPQRRHIRLVEGCARIDVKQDSVRGAAFREPTSKRAARR